MPSQADKSVLGFCRMAKASETAARGCAVMYNELGRLLDCA